jgi:hypothetical protein
MTLTNRPRLVAAACLSVTATLVTTVAFASFSSASSGRVYTVRTLATQGSTWISGGGKAMRPGRLSAGNQLFETNTIRRSDGKKGLFVGSVVVASPGTVAAQRAVGLMHAVYRFPDGDVYAEGTVLFGGPSGSGVITGGTGAYAGARGTITSTDSKDVIHVWF